MAINTRIFRKITFADQVKIMSEIDLLFGMHGAAFCNIMFMRPRSGFIEFFSPTARIVYYQNMAKKCDLVYSGISKVKADLSRGVPKDHRNMNVFVDLSYAGKVFSSIVEEVKKQKYARVNSDVL